MAEPKQPEVNTQETETKQERPEPSVLQFTRQLHAQGIVPVEQVDAMEKFTKGEIDYGTMRSLCG